MTNEEKQKVLYADINESWDNAFDGWLWFEAEGNPNRFILGENHPELTGLAFFVGMNDWWPSGTIWIEYEPEKDAVEIIMEGRPIEEQFIGDFKALFEKYSPFGMEVTFKEAIPVISKKATVEPTNFLEFFDDFKEAYEEYYPLFYMFSAEFFEGFHVKGENLYD